MSLTPTFPFTGKMITYKEPRCDQIQFLLQFGFMWEMLVLLLNYTCHMDN